MSVEPEPAKDEAVGFKSFKYVDDEKPGYWFGIAREEEGPYDFKAPVGSKIEPAGWGPVSRVWYKVYDERNECVVTSSHESEPPGEFLTDCVTGPSPIDPPSGA